MSRFFLLAVLAGMVVPAGSDRQNVLTGQERADGWRLLFDGRSLDGWKAQGDVTVEGGTLTVGGRQPSSLTLVRELAYCNVQFEATVDDAKDARLSLNSYRKGGFLHAAPPGTRGWCHFFAQVTAGDISVWATGTKGFGVQGQFNARTELGCYVPAGQKMRLRNIKFKAGQRTVPNLTES